MWANADEPTYGRLRIDRPVERFGDVVAHGRQPLDAPVGQARVAELELQVGDHGGEVRVPGAFTEPVERPLDVAGSRGDRGHRVGDRAAGVVVAVDADDRVVTDVRLDVGDDTADLVGQGAAVGVAQHEVRRTVDDRGFDGAERELGARLVPVEEVLEIDEHHAALAVQEPHRVGDHRRALVERGLQRFEYLVLGALRHDAHRRSVRLDQVAQGRVVVDLAARPPRRPERDERRGVEPQLGRGAGEELDVLRVGAGPPALDVVDAEEVELLGDAQLVVDGRGDALDLETVSQCGVEDFDRAHELLPRNEEAARRAA